MLMLPKLYPDELLYSAVARYLAYGRGASLPRGMADRMTTELFGIRCRHRIDLPRFLDRVAEETKIFWQLSSVEIAKNHTLFPYFSYGWPESIANKTLGELCGKAGTLISSLPSLHNWRIGLNKHLRYCDECRSDDIARYGETYWHRVHQLVGVLVCPKHGTALCETAAPYQPHKRSIYCDATDAACTGTTLDNLNKKISLVTLTELAKRCADILWGVKNRWDSGQLRSLYREGAALCGFTTMDGSYLYRQKINKAFHDFFTGAELKLLGVEMSTPVLGSMFNERNHLRFHPLEHALVQIFLESLPEKEKEISGLLGPWQCPNTVFKHEQDFPLTEVSLITGLSNQKFGFCTCRCGFRFTFYNAREGEPNIPFVRKLRQAESSWVKHIISLRAKGMIYEEISKEMGVSVSAIKRILKNPDETYEHVSAEKIQGWIAQWRKLRGRFSAKNCRVNHFDLYKKLRQYAPESLINDRSEIRLTDTDKGTRRGRRSSPVDWLERDRLWSAKIEDAIARILVDKPVPISMALILREAGLREAVANQLAHLPRCKRILEIKHETDDDYYIRRIRYAVEMMHASGEKILPSIVKRKANIVSRKLGSAAIAEFERLTKFR